MRRSKRSLIVAMGIACALLPGQARAQLSPGEKPPTQAATAAEPAPAIDCSKVADPERQAAVGEARRLLEASWLVTGRGLFTAYTMPGEKRHPFDLKPKAALGGPRNGFVLARSVVCTLETIGLARPQVPLRIRFVAPLYRFHEIASWSRPMRDGLVMEVEAMPAPGRGWQVRETKHEKAILEPEVSPRRPEESELPKSSRWPEPVPGCRRDEHWNGDACIARRRKISDAVR